MNSVSRLWSAKGDERCSPPRSDDYKHWSLMQLKREITQQQLKTNPRRRNKDAFARVLLQNDQEETKTPAQTLGDSVVFVPTSSSALQNVFVNSSDHQQDIYGTKGGRPQAQQELCIDHQHQQQEQQKQQEPIDADNEEQEQPQAPIYAGNGEQHQLQQQIFDNCGVIQAARLALPAIDTSTHVPTQTSVHVAANAAPTRESEAKGFQAIKRQRMERVGQERGERENVNHAAASGRMRPESTAQLSGTGATEYLRRKLSVQAARLEIESRRLDLEIKREQRNSELHAVQLALAQEQLQQAEITTQKMKTEWMVEQMIQKKKLNDVGISQNDSTALGMYLS